MGDYRPVTHITVTPKARKSQPFSVQVQGVSVMNCDYEGPQIELDSWKLGLTPARALRRKGNTFQVAADMLTLMPPFPAYTQEELRLAIGKQLGTSEMSSIEDAKPCKPLLRGHRFTVKYGPETVQELSVYTPGGC